MKPDRIYVVGVGMTRFGLYPERSIKDLIREAVEACLKDAGAGPKDVDAIYYANMGQAVLEGQTATPGQIALRPLGFEGIPIANVENGCASGSTALYSAWLQLKAGEGDVALAVGAEKLSADTGDKRDALFTGGLDVYDRAGVIRALESVAAGGPEAPPVNGHRSVFMDVYGYWIRGHMRDFGTTQAQLAAISSKNHGHSMLNPYCQFQRPFTIEEVLAGRPLSYPLTVPMCAPYSDGAAAALLCTADGVRKLGAEAIAVPIEALVLCSSVDRDPMDWDRHIGRIAADIAYRKAGVTPDDIDLAEMHDATAFGELVHSENLSLVPRGEGGRAAENGETRLGGKIPINVSGGLESRGHPLGATGLAQIHELVTQLRGRAGPRQVPDARYAIVENSGGLYGIEEASAVVGILSAPNQA
ncbi:thiolase family protein [Rhodoligotrophos defluvii]|uniref:thiolase family protein n=1 Tax=Rhodoligotrophos defluvii TaxID=2561934 RepID=UPI0010C98326|nr:thiolase family protein [Rhodoligotrophos defluvii]